MKESVEKCTRQMLWEIERYVCIVHGYQAPIDHVDELPYRGREVIKATRKIAEKISRLLEDANA
jgi:hypothetical protein